MRQAYDYWQNQPGNYLDGIRRSVPKTVPKGRRMFRWEGNSLDGCLRRQSTLTVTCCLCRHPIAPTEFPKKMSAAGPFSWKAFWNCGMVFSRGGYLAPITPRGGYQCRLTSECLAVGIAIGQPSTDLNRAHRVYRQDFSKSLFPVHHRRMMFAGRETRSTLTEATEDVLGTIRRARG